MTIVAALCGVVAGCDSWFGEAEDPPLPGERIPVMLYRNEVHADPALQSEPVVLPRPVTNPDWPQAEGYANHAMQHLYVADLPKREWSASVGSSARRSQPRLPPPIVAEGKVYAMDALHRVSAFDASSGKRLWQTSLAPDDEKRLIPGGIAYERGRVIATAGFAQVIGLDATSGEEIWRVPVDAPIHAPPTVRDGRVFTSTVNNTLYALDVSDGSTLWTYPAIIEMAAVVGSASPAVEGGVVVAPFTSGELVALWVENGSVLWADSLASPRRTDELSTISHIRASPVIDRGRVYAVSYGGVMAAIDLRTGQRIWDQSIGGLERPWVAGDYIYVVTADRQLLALERNSGRFQWVTQLPTYEDEEDREDPIFWSGPVLVSDRLVLTGSNGLVLAASPYTGELLGKVELADEVTVPPVVADGTLYFLSEDAELLAYR